jgi:hypothetical protein
MVEGSPSPIFDPAANRLRAVTPQAPPDTKEVPEWKRRSLQRILISCAAGLLCVVAMLVIFNSNPLSTLTFLLLLGAIIMGVTWWTEGLDFHLRAALMTGVVAALAVWSIYTRGFMNPSAVAGLASLVLTTSLFFGRAAAWWTFAAATGVFLVGALIPMDPIRFDSSPAFRRTRRIGAEWASCFRSFV